MVARWDWDARARRTGVKSDGTFNLSDVRLPDTRALIWQRTDGSTVTLSGADLRKRAEDMAAVLAHIGVRRGDRVAGLLGRTPTVFAAAMATWRLGAIYVPLFTGFAGDGLRVRLVDSGAVVVVTDRENRGGLSSVLESVPSIEVLVTDGPGEAGDAEFERLLPRMESAPGPVETTQNDLSTIMYTSGTTGAPKGCLIPHRAVVSLLPYVRYCLALGRGDVLFSGADAGWSFGLFTTGFAPMAEGVTRVVYEGPFDPAGWWACVGNLGASHLAAAPTAFRQLSQAGADAVASAFRAGTSAGEPLDQPTVEWFRENASVMLHDSYGLSELGMVIANPRTGSPADAAAGSMGVSLPGYEIGLVDSRGEFVAGPGTGRVSVRDNGYFLSRGYWGRQAEWDSRFQDSWFLTEDIATRDDSGRYWYVGRADDMIVTAGYNVSPVEVETALLSHPSVVDAGCVAEPDAVKGQIVTAHVILAGEPPNDLLGELRRWVGNRVGRHAAPRRVVVRTQLPRTTSGKLQRQVLRDEAVRPTPGNPQRGVTP